MKNKTSIEDYKQSLIKWLEGENITKNRVLKLALLGFEVDRLEGWNEAIDSVIKHIKEQ